MFTENPRAADAARGFSVKPTRCYCTEVAVEKILHKVSENIAVF